MGTAERRLEILKYLCRTRHATMAQLAKDLGVSQRTIQRDVYEIEATFHAPIVVKCGKYDGGVYLIGDYSFDRIYMCEEELLLLRKTQKLLAGRLTEKENALLSRMIQNYSRSS